MALRWDRFDLRAGTVRIEAGELRVPGLGVVTTDTKTGERATLSLDTHTLELLRKHRDEAERVAAACGIRLPADTYVFGPEPDGSRAWHPDTLSARTERLRAAVPGAERVTLKSLRAFVASELEADGADLTTAQAVLRHRSSTTTARHYKAAREARVRQATRDLGNRLTGRG